MPFKDCNKYFHGYLIIKVQIKNKHWVGFSNSSPNVRKVKQNHSICNPRWNSDDIRSNFRDSDNSWQI